LFSKVQEVGDFENIFLPGNHSGCEEYFASIGTCSAPTSLTASITNSVLLVWTDNSTLPQEDGFGVERSENSGSTYLTIMYTGTNVSSAIDTDVFNNHTYWYRVYAFNSFGNSGYSNTASIFITASIPTITSQPQSITASLNSNVTFSVSASGDPPLTYQWQSGSSNLSDNAKFTGSNTNILYINSVQYEDTGSGYRVIIVSGIGGTVTSNYGYLYVVDPYLYDLTGSAFTLGQYDTFAEYPAETDPTNKGIGWPAGSKWEMTPRVSKVIVADDVFFKYNTIFSYTPGSAVSGSDTGYGWSGSWNVIEGI
jgi:hypothetical protein